MTIYLNATSPIHIFLQLVYIYNPQFLQYKNPTWNSSLSLPLPALAWLPPSFPLSLQQAFLVESFKSFKVPFLLVPLPFIPWIFAWPGYSLLWITHLEMLWSPFPPPFSITSDTTPVVLSPAVQPSQIAHLSLNATFVYLVFPNSDNP